MDTSIKLGIGSDHAGYAYKEAIIAYLEGEGYTVKNFGTYTADSVDYPDYVHPLANELDEGKLDMGILLCGSANGVCMTANKHQHIRAAICWENEIAELARKHNNANVICIPARYVALELAKEMVDTFLNTPFEGGRHEKRVEKIALTHM